MAFDKVREALFSAVQKSKGDSSLHKHQGKEDDELCSFVKGRIEDVRQFASRISHEGIWLTNIAYLLGFDSIYYDVNMRQFRPISYPGQFLRRTRVSVNRILPTCQNRAARLTKNAPQYDVRPKSMSEEDKEAARMALYLINQIWDQQQVNKKRLELIMWLQQCGHAYLKTCWDKTLGPKVPYRHHITNQVVMQPLGDIRIDVVNPFEVFPDALAKSYEELTYLTQARIRPIHYFREQYGEKGYLVKPEDVWLTSLQYEYRINTFNNQSGAATGVNNLIKNSAIECSYYERPSYKHPNGRMIVVANGVVLKNDELPIDELPFSKFDDVMVAGKYYSESIITHMRPIQDQYNRTVTQRAEWTNKLLTGKYLAPKGHGIAKDAFNDQSGEIIEYVPGPQGQKVEALQVPMIPSYAYEEDGMLTGMMDNIAGLGEPSQGKAPSADFAAIGLQYLVEQDETRIGVVTEQHEYAYAGTGRHILKYAENNYDYPRLLRVAGKGMEYTIKEFRGAEINGNNDVIVIKGSTRPGSKVLKRQEIMNLHQQGYLGNPQDPKVIENVLNMLEYGDIQEVWKDHTLDMGQIKRYLDMIQAGQKPPVSEFDNHGLFLQEYNRFRKSEKFLMMTPQSQQILLDVMNEHLEEMGNLMAPAEDSNPDFQDQQGAEGFEAEVQAKEGVPMGSDPTEVLDEMGPPAEGVQEPI